MLLKNCRILIFVVGIVVSLTSCLDDIEPRTKEMETEELNLYLSGLITLGYDVDTTALGTYYVTIDEGEGLLPKKGDTLIVSYAGYFVDGSMFGSSLQNGSDSTKSICYLETEDRMIPGFEDGLSMMNEGAKLELIIPSDLAYGSLGNSTIPAYSTLVFVVKMVKIKPVVSD